MPGPKHQTPRKPGDRPVLILNKQGELVGTKPRTKNKKQAKRLAARKASFNAGSAGNGLLCHTPGSQNRKK